MLIKFNLVNGKKFYCRSCIVIDNDIEDSNTCLNMLDYTS